jgi:hypothetical protein
VLHQEHLLTEHGADTRRLSLIQRGPLRIVVRQQDLAVQLGRLAHPRLADLLLFTRPQSAGLCYLRHIAPFERQPFRISVGTECAKDRVREPAGPASELGSPRTLVSQS